MKKMMIGNSLVTALSVLAILAFVLGVPIASYISANNTAANFEARIEGAWDSNRSILSTHQQKVLEIAQVPAMYTDDLKKVIEADVQGRYGKDGSSATMQWIKERNLPFDSTMYTKIQQSIESGRNEFNEGQKTLVDIKQRYEAIRNSAWTGMWMRIAGYPKKDLSKFAIVTTDRTEAAFSTGREAAPLKLR